MRVRRKGSLQPKQKERESKREKHPAVQAAGLSHFLKELEEVIAIGVCNTSRQHRGREQWGRRGEGGEATSQNQILLMCQQHTLALLPNVPESHTNLEVLNTTPHSSPKPGSTWTDQKPKGARGWLGWPSSAPGRLSNPPLGGIICSEMEMVGRVCPATCCSWWF